MPRLICCSPERKPTPATQIPVLAQTLELSIFDKPIKGRNWRNDCARRDLLLTMIGRCGNKAGHLSLMRNFVGDMLAFDLEEKKAVAHQRGIGSEGTTTCVNYCPAEASLPANCQNKQLVSTKKKKALPVGYSPVKKIKHPNVPKGKHAPEAQPKLSSCEPIRCVPVNGMAKTFAQVVASLQSVQPHASKSLWKNAVPE
uniref:60S ribosomal protein L29 n=1 Tax=Globodera pallida TaxID=36090 RepID=A0A183BQU5_GLOPA